MRAKISPIISTTRAIPPRVIRDRAARGRGGGRRRRRERKRKRTTVIPVFDVGVSSPRMLSELWDREFMEVVNCGAVSHYTYDGNRFEMVSAMLAEKSSCYQFPMNKSPIADRSRPKSRWPRGGVDRSLRNTLQPRECRSIIRGLSGMERTLARNGAFAVVGHRRDPATKSNDTALASDHRRQTASSLGKSADRETHVTFNPLMMDNSPLAPGEDSPSLVLVVAQPIPRGIGRPISRGVDQPRAGASLSD